MEEKLTAIFLVTRPVNFLITFVSVIVAATICSPLRYFEYNVLLAAISAGLAASSGNIINDVFDIETDKINQPQRPLPSEKISIKDAYILYLIVTVVSLIFSICISLPAFLIVLSSQSLLFIYSKFLKRIPLVGNIAVALLTGLVFIFGGVVVGNPSAAIVPAIFAFLINLIREIVKDLQDIKGDKNAGLLTFPIKFGLPKSRFLISFFTIVLITFTLYPFISKLYKIEFFIVVMVLLNPILIFCLKKIFEDYSENSLKKVSNLLKLSMILGLVAIYFGV